MTLAEQVELLLAGPRPLPIVTAGHPVLRRPAVDYDGSLDAAMLRSLIDAMHETMLAAPGVGLAAPQVGLGVRIAVLEDSADIPPELAAARGRSPLPFTVLINPRYEVLDNGVAAAYEGCLSVPGYRAVVSRAERVRIRATSPDGAASDAELTGWSARIVQHECDPLDGILYLDRAELRSLADSVNHDRWWAGPSLEPARRMLGF